MSQKPGETAAAAPAEALRRWRGALGAKHVKTEPELLAMAGRATFDRPAEIPAVLSPGSVEEIRAALRIATETRTRVHVVSTGKNWGLGSRQPARSPSVLIELSRLDRILAFDDAMGTITVQPGVTFRQVDDFLEAQGSIRFLAQIGGSPFGSPVANALERGDGHGAYGDRANAVAGLEAVLPTGEIIQTGYRRWGRSRLSAACRNGPGPALDGLFFQSNFGVVTEASLWLQPKPAHYSAVTWAIGDAQLAAFVNACRALIQEGVLTRGSLAVWNRYKWIARSTTYPFAETSGRTPLPLSYFGDGPAWVASASLFSPSAAVDAALRELISQRTAPATLGHAYFDARNPPEGVDGPFPSYRSTGANLRTAYWRMRALGPEPLDPERDGCGVIWLCPAAPFCGEAVREIFSLSERLGLEHGFEAHLGLNPSSAQHLNVFVALMFDRAVAGESARAMACHDALMTALIARGFPPYRLGAHAMDAAPPGDDDSAALLRDLKARVDPAGVLAPGRYGV